jgi:hypothetical protein
MAALIGKENYKYNFARGRPRSGAREGSPYLLSNPLYSEANSLI